MKESSTLGKTINYQEEFRKQPGPVRLFLFESRFLRSVSKGPVGIRCRERERERNKGSKATLLKLLEKFLVRPTPPLFPSNSRDPTSNEAAPPYDPSAKGIDSCSVLCAITTTLEYKSTGPMETTETGFRAARSGGGDTYGTRFNRGTKKLAATTISMVDRFRAESLNFLLHHCRPFVRRYIYFLLLFLFLRDPAILSS